MIPVTALDAIESLPSGALFIDGERFGGATLASIDHIDPSTGAASKAFALAGPSEVDAAG